MFRRRMVVELVGEVVASAIVSLQEGISRSVPKQYRTAVAGIKAVYLRLRGRLGQKLLNHRIGGHSHKLQDIGRLHCAVGNISKNPSSSVIGKDSPKIGVLLP